MGVDYRVWVLPRQRSFRPSAEQFARLANALRDGNWAPMPDTPGQGSQIIELLPGNSVAGKKPARVQGFDNIPFTSSWVEFHSQHELVMDWHVRNLREAGVQYPFVFDPYPDSGPPYFYVRLILGRDYFYWTGENVMPFDDATTECVCGEQLSFWTDWAHGTPSQRIQMVCPQCGQRFDPSGKACDILDGWSGAPTPLIGGLTFRFALVVDCHKYWPHDEDAARRFHLRSGFLDLWRKTIEVPFETVVTFD
jgi:hypothetical protein